MGEGAGTTRDLSRSSQGRREGKTMLDIFNACLRLGMFGGRWKVQRLVLLDKGKGFPVTPSSFRPLCMLDCTDKIFERLIRTRLRGAVGSGISLADNQYGFREVRSMVMAIEEVTPRLAKPGTNRTEVGRFAPW